MFFILLSRRELIVDRSSEVFFNKRVGDLLFCSGLLLLLPFPAGRGGEEKGWLVGAICCDGEGWGLRDTALDWSSSSVALVWLPTLDAGGQQLLGLAFVMRQVFCNLLWRPYVSPTAEFILATVPSGLVPGAGGDGRCARLRIDGGVGGPDGVFIFIFRVFYVKVKDVVYFCFFCKVLFVTCIAPR
jgi:hypothetical protein